MAESVLRTPLHVVLFCAQMKRPRFKSLVVSGFSGHEKTKQETDTLYQSPVPDLVPVTGLEPVRDCSQGILSPWCLPFHHTGVLLHSTTPGILCQDLESPAFLARSLVIPVVL